MSAVDTVLGIASNEIGYHERGENITKYAEEIDRTAFNNGPKNGFAWCAVFVEWVFYKAFGENTAMNMLGLPKGSAAAACSCFAQYMAGKGLYHHTGIPEPGDIVFFYSGDGINHVGIAEKVLNGAVYTIEGNSGDSVRRNSYYVGDKRIAGFGRPDWGLAGELPAEEPEAPDEFIGSRRYMTLSTLEYDNGDYTPRPRVKAWQNLLIEWGANLEADGQYGPLTKAATLKWQIHVKEIGGDVEANGIVDEDDWIEIIKIEVR